MSLVDRERKCLDGRKRDAGEACCTSGGQNAKAKALRADPSSTGIG